MVSVEVPSLRQIATIGVYEESSKVNKIDLKSSLSINNSSELALVHLFLMTVIKVGKFSPSEYLEFFRSYLAANLVILVATSYLLTKMSIHLLQFP